jgi:hypothetical protein
MSVGMHRHATAALIDRSDNSKNNDVSVNPSPIGAFVVPFSGSQQANPVSTRWHVACIPLVLSEIFRRGTSHTARKVGALH